MIPTFLCLALTLAGGDYEPGKVSTIKTKDVHYALRVPKDLVKAKGGPAIVFIHGSNMRGENYALSLETARELNDWVLIAPTGPKQANEKAYNHDPGDERYVEKVIDDVEKRLKIPITRLYVGGHSQGAFLSHAVAAAMPDRVDGVLAVSGGSWAAPRRLMRKGKNAGEIPIALVHAQNDPVVPIAVSVEVYDAYRKAKHEDVRLFAPTDGEHMFLRLPIVAAFQWLELMNQESTARVSEIQAKVDVAKDPRTAWDANRMRQRLDKSAGDAASKKITADAKKSLADLTARLAKAKKPLDDKLRADCYTYLAEYGMLEGDGAWREQMRRLMPS
jgi:predicted esterase